MCPGGLLANEGERAWGAWAVDDEEEGRPLLLRSDSAPFTGRWDAGLDDDDVVLADADLSGDGVKTRSSAAERS